MAPLRSAVGLRRTRQWASIMPFRHHGIAIDLWTNRFGIVDPAAAPRTGAGLRPSPRRVSTSGGNTTGRVMQIKLSEADRELMQGVIDMHLHAMPCLIDRPFSEL